MTYDHNMAASVTGMHIRLLHRCFFATVQSSFPRQRSFNFYQCLKRTLFSGEILGIENFKRFRIFEQDQLGENKETFVQKLALAKDDPSRSAALIPDLRKLIYVATTHGELSLIVDLLHKCYVQKLTNEDTEDGSNEMVPDSLQYPRHFQLGPLFMRLLYVLKNTDAALSVWQDQRLKKLFQKNTCYLVLMDMLYNDRRYQAVVDTFCQMKKAQVSPVQYPLDCTTLALAALYQLNTEEALQEAKKYIEEAKEEGSPLSRRLMLFVAALALKQRDSVLALEIADHLCKETGSVFKNVKITGLAQLGHLQAALDLMEEGLWVDVPTQTRFSIIYSDTVECVAERVQKNQDMARRFMKMQKLLDREGLLSPQTLTDFVERPILKQRKQLASHSFKKQSKPRIYARKLFETSCGSNS